MNIVRFLPKIALAASVSLAMAFTLSCSSDNDDSDSSKPIVYIESYTLKEVTGRSFTYEETYEDYECKENGVLEPMSGKWDNTINYSINGNVLSWDTYWNDRNNATLDFTGTSSNLYGTWIRTKNKSADCEIRTDEDDDYQYYSCKDGWRFTKVVFKENPKTIELTTDYCATDGRVEGNKTRGYTVRIVNCNTYEFYKGSSVITVKYTESGYTVSHSGKSCTYDGSYSKLVQACKDAWTKHVASGDSYFSSYSHENLIYEEYDKCEENILPTDWVKYYDNESSAKVLKKDPLFNAKRSR